MIIDVYADIVCPWCYIGARRLEQAIAQRPELRIERRWQPFQLRPEMPAAGEPWHTFADEKFGGMARARAAFDQVTRVGAGDDLEFRFDRVASAPNTVDAHRLVLYAARHDRQWAMANALFAAYFTDGRDLNNADHLIDVARSVGLDANDVRRYLIGDADRATLEQSQMQAYQHGVRSVPHYVIDSQWALVGAQPVEVLVQALDYVAGAQQGRGVAVE